jgi:hypothetical protein
MAHVNLPGIPILKEELTQLQLNMIKADLPAWSVTNAGVPTYHLRVQVL